MPSFNRRRARDFQTIYRAIGFAVCNARSLCSMAAVAATSAFNVCIKRRLLKLRTAVTKDGTFCSSSRIAISPSSSKPDASMGNNNVIFSLSLTPNLQRW